MTAGTTATASAGSAAERGAYLHRLADLIEANVEKLEAGPKGVVVQFRGKQFPNPAALVGYIAKQGAMAKIRPDHSVFLTRDLPTPEKRLSGAAVVMTQLAELAKAG